MTILITPWAALMVESLLLPPDFYWVWAGVVLRI